MENNIRDKINDIDRSINATYLSIVSDYLSLIYFNAQKQSLINGTPLPKCINTLDALTNILALLISDYLYFDSKETIEKQIKEGKCNPQDYLEYIADGLVMTADIISVASDVIFGPSIQSAGEAFAAETGV
jgi:hypothetical protein